jgi:hypothetical protein
MLREESKIARFEPDMEVFGIRVWLTENGEFDDLKTVPGVESISEANITDACSANSATALQDMLRAAQAYHQVHQEQSQVSLKPQATAAEGPTIHIYISSYVSYGTRYSGVSGETTPNTTVNIRVETSDANVIVEQAVTSNSSGYYSLYPARRTCEGYGWSLAAGQTVIVEAQGKTSVMQIPVIDGTADPDANNVTGKTDSYRDVMLRVIPTYATCNSESYTATTTSETDGTFQFNLAPKGGFDHSGSIYMYAYDSKGNYAYTSLIVPYIYASQWSIGGEVTKPSAYVTVQLWRGGSVVETMETIASESGNFYIYTFDLQTGDRIEVESSGLAMYYDVAPLDDILVDMPNGRVTGTTTPGLRVRGYAYSYCSGWYGYCDSDNANVSGHFSFDFNSEVLRQEDISIYTYDSQGHYQYGWFYPPYVQYRRTSFDRSYIKGYWYSGETEVTVRVYNGGTVEEEYTDELYSDLYYFVDVDHRIPLGRRIEVSDGTHTRSIIVQKLEARLDAASDTVVGVAPTSGVLDIDALHQPPDDSWSSYNHACGVTTNAGGSYQADLSGDYDLVSDDSVEVTYFENDGDQLFVWGYDVSINVSSNVDVAQSKANNSQDVEKTILSPTGGGGGGGYWFSTSGNRADKNQPITVEVYASDGTTLRESWTDSSVPSRSYYFYSSNFSLQPGNLVRASNGAYTTSFTVPHLTLDESPQENRLYGSGPVYATIYPQLYLRGRSVYWYTSVQVGSDGYYSASFDRVYPSSYDCMEATVGGCKQAKVTYYDSVGHSLTVEGESPPYVSTDEYDEGNDDNAPERASVYQFIQSHTFHDYYDRDWIAVNIPTANVGRMYSFQTLNLGDIAQTNLYLYDTDQATQLASYTGPDDAAIVRWQPTHAGWYYVQVTPRDSSENTYYCGATYDFRIQLEAEWTALIYMNGDSDLGVYPSFARSRLEQVVGELKDVNVVMLWDGMDTHTGDTWRYHVQPNGQYQDGENRWYMGELNLGDGNTLADFLKWGMESYPASHYYAVVADHGKGTVGLSWDFNAYEGENIYGTTKNFSNSDRITPMELQEAMKQATNNGDQRIDVLHYDACLMGMWEHAYQVKDYADYLIFSQNEGWAVFAYDKYAQALSGDDARSVAAEIARLYSVEVELIARPYTISAIDLAQLDSLRQQVDQLANLLESGMSTYKQKVQASRWATQRLDSTGDFELTEEDTMLDLYDFATQIKSQITDAPVQNAATAVQTAVNQAVVVEYHQSGETPYGNYIDLSNTYGLSIYFPKQSGRLFSVYAGGQMFKSAVDSRWDETLTEYYGAMGLPPTMDDPDDTDPVIGQVDMPTIYLPLVVCLYGAESSIGTKPQ